MTDTFTGIQASNAPGFIVGQIAGAARGSLLFRWFDRGQP
jgi:hypothetical protein